MLPVETLKALGLGQRTFGAISFNAASLMPEGSCSPKDTSVVRRKRARVSVSLTSPDHQAHLYKMGCHGPAQQGFTL